MLGLVVFAHMLANAQKFNENIIRVFIILLNLISKINASAMVLFLQI